MIRFILLYQSIPCTSHHRGDVPRAYLTQNREPGRGISFHQTSQTHHQFGTWCSRGHCLQGSRRRPWRSIGHQDPIGEGELFRGDGGHGIRLIHQNPIREGELLDRLPIELGIRGFSCFTGVPVVALRNFGLLLWILKGSLD